MFGHKMRRVRWMVDGRQGRTRVVVTGRSLGVAVRSDVIAAAPLVAAVAGVCSTRARCVWSYWA